MHTSHSATKRGRLLSAGPEPIRARPVPAPHPSPPVRDLIGRPSSWPPAPFHGCRQESHAGQARRWTQLRWPFPYYQLCRVPFDPLGQLVLGERGASRPDFVSGPPHTANSHHILLRRWSLLRQARWLHGRCLEHSSPHEIFHVPHEPGCRETECDHRIA